MVKVSSSVTGFVPGAPALQTVRRHLVIVLRALEAGRVILAAIAGAVRYPGQKLEPLAQALATLSVLQRLHWSRTRSPWRAPAVQAAADSDALAEDPKDPVSCQVIYDPGTEHIRADVVFIHGINGSLTKTWMQGVLDHRSLDGIRTQLLKTYNAAAAKARRHYRYKASCRKRLKQRVCEDMDVSPDDDPEDADLLVCHCDECRPDAEEEPSACWPKDWLPLDCPGVRIVAVDYSSDPYLWRPVWVPKHSRRAMRDRSEEMREKLMSLGVGRRPIVWVAHSKGGLFVKQILVIANDRCRDLVTNTQGIMFYSVPHRGSSLAKIHIPFLLGPSIEITEVKKDCPEVQELHQQFLSLYSQGCLQADVVSLVESLTTPLFFTYVRVVDEESADPGVGEFYSVSSNHKDICKPTSRSCVLYRELASLINRVT